MVPVALGICAGLLGAWYVSRLLERFLFEISPLDPVAYIAAVGSLGAVGALACYVPARRATRVDPILALKAE